MNFLAKRVEIHLEGKDGADETIVFAGNEGTFFECEIDPFWLTVQHKNGIEDPINTYAFPRECVVSVGTSAHRFKKNA